MIRSPTEIDSALSIDRYCEVRRFTESLCEPLAIEDYQLQSMPNCSPPKWHLAHSTWFFETFVLAEYEQGFRPFHPRYSYLFNSYYEAVGDRWPRAARGLLSRPTVAEVCEYRRHVDGRVRKLLGECDGTQHPEIAARIELGLNHEQQHQELLLTDIKHAFALNPLRPVYRPSPPATARDLPECPWRKFPEGMNLIGHTGEGFAFDNETPRHRAFLAAFEIAQRPVAVGEYLEFISAGGYGESSHWLSDGWAACQKSKWIAPLYWEESPTGWRTFTLAGTREIDLNEPVCHLSYYEADAYARWAGARLPTEAEWEIARVAAGAESYGEVWEWTASPYSPYPGYRAASGGVGEYNGKFMCNQMVLRGGSSITPVGHSRPTYRNFFAPDARWQVSGLRLARDHRA